jgi:hypothetical protein
MPAPEQKPKERPFADVPDAFFVEADQFIQQCESNPNMRQYYNCECLGYEYLNIRIKKPKIDRTSIIADIKTKCLDASGAAGAEYDRCMGNFPLLPDRVKPEEYCQCFASTYAKLFEKYKLSVSSKVIVELQTQAYISCTDPALSQKLYPYQPPPQ